VTPYIHLLCNHGSWYWLEYGPLALWNCQGLERSNSVFKRLLLVRAPAARGVGRPGRRT
jgi:hypothetical protein